MNDILDLTLTQAKKALQNKTISAIELTQTYLDQMEKRVGLNAYITPTPEKALAQAHASDKRLSAGQGGDLEGIPLGIKDLFCTKGTQTTAGSKILEGFIPPYESTVTQNLWDAGAVMLGKLNMDEFAMGSANITSAYGPCINPWKDQTNPQRQLVPGGSSGGSVAAVAGRLALGATASDTGGSIRQPAAFCGVVGIKPTYGLCSRFGMVAFASSLDQAGPVGRSVEDCALMLRVMASYDAKDSTSLQVNIPFYEQHLTPEVKGLRIGIPKEYVDGLVGPMADLLKKGMAWFKDEGATIVDISLPMVRHALPTYYIIAPAEASSNLARYDGIRYGLRVEGKTLDEMYMNTRHDGFGAEVKRRIMIGTYVLSAGYYDAYYTKARKVQQLIAQDFKNAFGQVDIILTPTTVGAAFGLDEKVDDPLAMYLNDVYTVPVNLAGLPGISVPAGYSNEGLPLGLQLIGPQLSEQLLLNAALVIEGHAGFSTNPMFLR